jgi:two-component system NtrC family sensor kinase
VPKPALQETDINALIEQIVDFATHHTDMDAVEIVTTFDARLPRVWVDGDQIRQVAMNLMLNAGAAMPEGGRLAVGTALGENGWVNITFQDSGAGIPPENLEKIFEPFFTTKARGTGVGLAITRTIVEQHGGRIEIASEVGQGTRVTVSLPVNRERA